MFNDIGFTQILLLAALIVAFYGVRKALPGSGIRAWHLRHEGHASHSSPGANARWHRVLLLEALELVLAAVFLLVGGAKLIGRPDMVALFHDIGVGQWFRYMTGAIEVAGAVLLLLPLLTGASAMFLGAVMVVATLIELFVLRRPPVAALACLSGHTYVAWARVSRRHILWMHPDGALTPSLIRSDNATDHHETQRRTSQSPGETASGGMGCVAHSVRRVRLRYFAGFFAAFSAFSAFSAFASPRSDAGVSCSVFTTSPVFALTLISSMPERPGTLISYE
jgi:hypothetical protein